MNKGKECIINFCQNAEYVFVKYPNTQDTEIGKILQKEELLKVDFQHNEIYRSMYYVNNDMLFELDFKEDYKGKKFGLLDLIQITLENARIIETIFPNIFTWTFNGSNIVGYLIIPSGDFNSQGTISRYGGSENFNRVLRRHLFNIVKLKDDKSPNYDFLNLTEPIKKEILSIGSKNLNTNFYHIPIDLNESYLKILNQALYPSKLVVDIKTTRMKFWAREINPDFLVEAKHLKLENPLPIDYNIYDLYPEPIKRLINLKHKGNYNRFLLARFLLSVHSPKDAKFVYYSVLSKEELKHVKGGNCSSQWNFILNNMDRYGCPTMKDLQPFIEEGDEPLSHPLEKIKKLTTGETK